MLSRTSIRGNPARTRKKFAWPYIGLSTGSTRTFAKAQMVKSNLSPRGSGRKAA